MPEKLVAYRGLVGPQCPTYVAKRADDDAPRTRTQDDAYSTEGLAAAPIR